MGLLIALMALCLSSALEILLRFATRYRRPKVPSHQPDLVVLPDDSLQSLITGLLIALMALRVSSALEILLRFAARYHRPKAPSHKPGLVVLPKETACELDIVIVYGISPDSGRWSHCERHQKSLEDPSMLPSSFQTARIMIYNRNAQWFREAPMAHLWDHGQRLLHELKGARTNTRNRPIMVIAHSLGGIIACYAFMLAKADTDAAAKDILRSSIGFISLGTPFMKAPTPQLISDRMVRIFLFSGFSVKAMKRSALNDHLVQDKREDFLRLIEELRLPTVCFYESRKTDFGRFFLFPGLLRGMVVGNLSACMPGSCQQQLDADHLHMNKFSDHQDPSFQQVSYQVQHMNHESKQTIRYRSSPYPRDMTFVGREQILDRLTSLITPSRGDSDCKKIILYGVAGVGKTAIAKEFAFRLRKTYSNCNVLWASAFNATGFQNSCHKILQQLHREDPHTALVCDNASEVKLRFQLGLSRHPEPWLLIIDNVNDGELGSHTMNLASFLPFSLRGSILILTRNDRVSYELGVPANHTVRVGELRVDEGLEMFNKILGGPAVGHVNETADLIQFLECSPLAIKQAAAYIKQTKISVKHYLELYFGIDPVQIKHLSRGLPYAKSNRDPIASSWHLSFEYLEANATTSAKALKCISMLAAVDIPTALLDHFNPSSDTVIPESSKSSPSLSSKSSPSLSSKSSPSLPSESSVSFRSSELSRSSCGCARIDTPMSLSRDSLSGSSDHFGTPAGPKLVDVEASLGLNRRSDAAARSIPTSSKTSSKIEQTLQGAHSALHMACSALFDVARGCLVPSEADSPVNDVIITLELYGLLSPQADGELVDLPRPVRQVTRNSLFLTRDTCNQVSEAANAIRWHFPLRWTDSNLCSLLSFTPHLEELMATGNIQVGKGHQDELLTMLAEAYCRLYRLEEAEDIRRKLAVDTMTVYGTNKLITWKRMMDLVEVLFDRTSYEEALDINIKTLDHIERIEHSSLDERLASMSMLGRIYEKLEMFDKRDKIHSRLGVASPNSPASQFKQKGRQEWS